MSKQQHQQATEPDLSRYDGQWVAVRDGSVIANATDEGALRADPRVCQGDDVYPIGDPPAGFYMINI